MAKQLKCLIRGQWISAQPEEMIRQKWIAEMIGRLGFHRCSFLLEKELRSFPMFSLLPKNKIPSRRSDLVILSKHVDPKNPLYPLLLMEFKAIPLTQKAVNQVVGYNHYLKACFIAVANDTEIKVGWLDKSKGEYCFIDYLPSYDSLVKSATIT